ncbi:unannotated protein [freshwater metagenome]|uniref:Unannotated protein n=1 Tax=freshwater metagenome TaxID=449393 RepID=A0A6J6G0M4_9ZZZZ
MGGAPAEHGLDAGGVGVGADRVARTATDDLVRHGATGDPLGRTDHVEDAAADAGADVERHRLAARREVVQRAHVCVGEVLDVDVVADAGAVGGGVVVAEHLDGRPLAERRLHHERDQVERLRPVLADHGVLAGAGRVEVPQVHGAQPVGDAVPAEDPLDHRLGLGVDALGVDRGVLGDRHGGRRAVHRAARGEHDLADVGREHRLDEVDGAGDVVEPVLLGPLHRLADVLVGGEVDDGGDAALAAQVGDQRPVADVAHHQVGAEQGGAVAELQGVEDDHVTSAVAQHADGVRADVAGSAGHEGGHGDLQDGVASGAAAGVDAGVDAVVPRASVRAGVRSVRSPGTTGSSGPVPRGATRWGSSRRWRWPGWCRAAAAAGRLRVPRAVARRRSRSTSR